MPKLLAQVRENALLETRRILREEGYDALTMRAIARKCGIAVGTLYNYFPSKEYLTGCVVLADWQAAYRDMQGAVGRAATPQEGIRGIYEGMYEFVAAHQYLLAFHWSDAPGQFTYADRHKVLLRQICGLLQELLASVGSPMPQDLMTFLAESILNSSVKQYPYSDIERAIEKLL